MNTIDLWHLCDELTASEATLLLLGLDPSDYEYIEREKQLPAGYQAISTALKNGVLSKSLKATIVEDDNGFSGNIQISWYGTTINVLGLKEWLKNKNFTNNFFFENEQSPILGFSDPENIFYAPKLSAATNAWKSVTSDPESLNGRTPKQAIEKWLRQNAQQYGLTKEDGSPNESAIAEISKIANWKPEGGVAKTSPRLQANPSPEDSL